MQSEEEKKLVELVKERYVTARDGRNSCYKSQDNIQKYINKYTSTISKHDNTPPMSINLLAVGVENMSALMSDTPIDITVQPKTAEFALDAFVYQQAIKWVMEKNSMPIKREGFQKNGFFFGTGIYNLRVEEDNDGENEIFIDVCDPRLKVVDPLATCPEDIEYTIDILKYTKEEIKDMYPNFVIEEDEDTGDSILSKEITEYNQGEQDHKKKKITVYQMYDKIRKKVDGKLKYPYGRFVLCTDDQLIENRRNEKECGFPTVMAPCKSLPDRIFGIDYCKDLKPIVDEMNEIMKELIVIMNKTANPRLIYNTLMTKLSKITNAIGNAIGVKGDVRSAMTWERPPTVSDIYYRLMEMLNRLFMTLSGMQDVMVGRGEINANMPSGKSIEALQDAAQTVLRSMIRNIKLFAYSPLGKKLAQLIHQVYTEEKMVRITGLDTERVQEVMNREKQKVIEQLKEDGAVDEAEFEEGIRRKMEEKGINYEGGENGEGYISFTGARLGDPNNFFITVKAGTDIPRNKLDVIQETRMLKQSGDISLEPYLDIIEIPEHEKQKILQGNQEIQLKNQVVAIAEVAPELFQQFMQAGQQALQEAQQKPQPGQKATGPGVGAIKKEGAEAQRLKNEGKPIQTDRPTM